MVPDHAIAVTDANLSLTKSQFKNLVASHDIAAGVPIVDTDFVAQGQVASGLAGQLQTDQTTDKTKYQAVTLSIDDTHAVAGMLHPGDSVNALFTGTLTDITSNSGKGVRTTAFLLPGLKVIGVGSTTSAPVTTGDGRHPRRRPRASTARSSPSR